MNPVIKINRSGFEEYIKSKLPAGSKYGDYVRGLDARIKNQEVL